MLEAAEQPSNLTGWVRGMLLALFASNAGSALQIAAQAWFMWEKTQSAQQLGLLGLVQATPLLGIPLLGGMMADAWPRRSVLLFTQTVLAAISALMAILAFWGALPPGVLLLLAGLLSTVMALDNPVRQVYLPGVVHASQRGRIVGLNALTYNSGAVIGPALAGLLLPLAGAGVCFLANSLSYLMVVAWLLRGPTGRPAPSSWVAPGATTALQPVSNPVKIGGRRDRGMRVAARYLGSSPGVLIMLGMVAALSLLGRSYVHVLPALVNTSWRGDVTSYGTLAALPGVGAVVAAGLIAWLLGRHSAEERKRYLMPICLGALLLGCAVIALGLSPGLLAAGVVLAVVGFASTGTMTLLNAGLQRTTPNAVRGRVLSLYTILAAGMPALGGWMLGTLMYGTAPRVVLVAAGLVLVLLAGLLGLRLLRTPLPQEPAQ